MSRRPNILLTVADDQRFDTIGVLGNSDVLTPYLDRMAANGTAFTSAHHMGSTVPAVCAPSRAMLLTGRSLFHLPHELINGAPVKTNPIPLLPQLLRAGGYRTHAVGKWHNGKPAFARSFDSGKALFFGGMNDHFYTPVYNFDSTGHYPPEKIYASAKHSSDLFADAAIEFIETYDGDEPFFLYVAFTAPHDPRTAPPEYSALYPPELITLPPNFLARHPFDNGELEIRDELLESFPRQPHAIRQHLSDYYAMISHMDAAIGRIHAALERRGLNESTLAVHTADHGLAVGQHGLMGKQNLYEHSVRVPLLLRGPDVPHGETRDAPVYQHDLFPTLCSAAQIPVPEDNEFCDLWPLLADARTRTRSTLFGAYRNVQRMVKNEHWKLIEYSVHGKRHSQLYNWRDDLFELRDFSLSSAHQTLLHDLRAQLRGQQNRFNDSARYNFSI